MFFTVFMSLQSWGSKICTPVCWCRGVCILFIAQPCVINTLLMFCVTFLWFSLDWSKKALYCSNTLSMWHVKDCQVHSPRLVEDETYVFSRAWLKRDLRMNFKWTTCDKILFPRSVLACNFCTELNLLMCASIRVFSLNFEVDHFLRDNFNFSVGLAQWRGLAQNPETALLSVMQRYD